MEDFGEYAKKFQRLNCAGPAGRPRPHKAVMLLAVSLLAEADELQENRIEFDNRLLEIFGSLFRVARQDDDKKTPHLPFFHLTREGFWHLHPNRGRATALNNMVTARGPGQVRDVIASSSLDLDSSPSTGHTGCHISSLPITKMVEASLAALYD